VIGLDYKCLGKTEELRARRYQVLVAFLKGGNPAEIAKGTNFPIRQVYSDIDYLRRNPLNTLPVDIVRDFGVSFYEMKVTELERRAQLIKDPNSTLWLGIQKLIKEYKSEILKLVGASVERMELSGKVEHTVTATWLSDVPDMLESEVIPTRLKKLKAEQAVKALEDAADEGRLEVE